MRPLVLGTAGHIDHGKTALVRALTGTDTDRLPDEKRRGITIDLGFANLTFADGTTLSIVDVPGHEAFVRNMLAGATGIDLVLLVVAADEGVMPQTREHLAILELLGISRAVVALTKIDLVESEWIDLVREELADLLAATSLAGAPIVAVSARTGAGLDDLRSALAGAAAGVPPRADADLYRMPIDRIFTVRGTGTVVTGTVWSGSLRRDAHVRVLPADLNARVRGLQQHGAECAEVTAGARAAVALGGVDRTALTRGDTLLAGDAWTTSSMLTVKLQVVRDAAAPIRPRQRLRVHIGTAEVLGRVALLHGELAPGGSAIVQLRLEAPLVARGGDHLVVRSYSPVTTIGGGIVLEPAAPKRKRLHPDLLEALAALATRTTIPGDFGRAALEAAVVLAGPRGAEPRTLPLVTGLPPSAVEAALAASTSLASTGDSIVRADLLDSTEEDILRRVGEFHRADPMLDGMEREAVRRNLGDPPLFDAAVAALNSAGRLIIAGNALALPDHSAAPGPDAVAAMARLAEMYTTAGLEPPDLADLPPDLAEREDLPVLIRFLERDGRLLRLSATRLISATAVAQAMVEVRSQVVSNKQVGIADFKDVLKLTRKHLIPLLEYFDRVGVTRREGEGRVVVREGV